MKNILPLIFRKRKLFQDGRRHPGSLLSVTEGTIGLILVASSDIMQIGGHQKHVQVHPFNPTDVFTQATDPEGVIPGMTSAGVNEMFVSNFFYGIEHHAKLKVSGFGCQEKCKVS
jgi:hypothetical protein